MKMDISAGADQNACDECAYLGKKSKNLAIWSVIATILLIPVVMLVSNTDSIGLRVLMWVVFAAPSLAVSSHGACIATSGTMGGFYESHSSDQRGTHAHKTVGTHIWGILMGVGGFLALLWASFSIMDYTPSQEAAQQEAVELKENQRTEIIEEVGGGEIIFEAEEDSSVDYIVEYEGEHFSVNVVNGDNEDRFYVIQEADKSDY